MSEPIEREKYTPLEASRIAAYWRTTLPPWIVYEPGLVSACHVVEDGRNDGTMIFFQELMARLLNPLMDMRVCDAANPEPEGTKAVRYHVGEVRYARQFLGHTDLPCGRTLGQREAALMPIRCEYLDHMPPEFLAYRPEPQPERGFAAAFSCPPT